MARITPQQNGIAEWMNQTLEERANVYSQIADSKDFLPEAMNYCLVNCYPSTTMECKTPEDVQSGNPANYSILKVLDVWILSC